MGCLDTELGRVAVAGSGFLADGFDLYVIGEVEKILEAEFVCKQFTQRPCIGLDEFKKFKSLISSAALWGAVLGQLLFGTLADKLGRRVIFIVTGSLIILGSLLSACVQEFGHGPSTLLYQLAICRAILGFGIGGEYPLSATICAEGTSPERRGTLMALVFANQGLGYLLSASLMVVLMFSNASLEFSWRFALAFGALVPTVSLYFRMQMHESEDFTKVAEARESGDSDVDLIATVRRYAWHVLGTAFNWLVFDVVFYANSLFNNDVTQIIEIGPGGLKSVMLRTLIIVLMSLPGYFVGVLLINRLGRKTVQLQGYFHMAVCFLICAMFYNKLQNDAPALFVLFYGLTFFFANFGPNLTTYVIPGEIFPSQAKATLHGVSAAAGKVGAAIGSMLMPMVTGLPPSDSGLKAALYSCAGLAVLGFVITLVLTPRYGPEDLVPRDSDETVGFTPLFFQDDDKHTHAQIASSSEEDDLKSDETEESGEGVC